MRRTAFTSRANRIMCAFAAMTIGVLFLAGCGTAHRASPTAASTSTTIRSVRPKQTTPTTRPATPYRVQRGDTLSEIAHRFGVSEAAIVARNHVANPDRLAAGQTLLIPPRPPLSLVVTPEAGPVGQTFTVHLVGAKPSETITFEVRSPHGSFHGPAHTAIDGSVTTTYQTSPPDSSGTYAVIAHGNAGTTISAPFRVLPPPTPAT